MLTHNNKSNLLALERGPARGLIVRGLIWICVSVFLTADFALAQEETENKNENVGRALYQEHCIRCHGENGSGTDEYQNTLLGDLPVSDLQEYIAETMPEDDPDACVDDDAKRVAQYMYDQFYSPAAQRRLTAARIELSRLTVRQFRESVADLVGSFESQYWIPDETGLQADYFAARRSTEKRRLSNQIDKQIDFADGVPHFDATGEYKQFEEKKAKKKDDNSKMNEGFFVNWTGSIVAPKTGQYEIVVESLNGFQLWINDHENSLIDREVRSDDVVRHKSSVYMLAGRAYPFEMKLFAYPDPPAKVRLLWTPPHRHEAIIPESAFRRAKVDETLAVSTAFPADDASSGYQRGISVSRQWDDSTTTAAIETANWISNRIWDLAGTKDDAPDRIEKAKAFCEKFVSRAFVKKLSEEEIQFFVGQHFDGELRLKDRIKRIVILTIKSPRFLYPTVQPRESDFETARRLSLAMWDSMPDEQLYKLASKGKLGDPETMDGEMYRMVVDPRSKSKLSAFFQYWLKTEKAAEASKDKNLYPGFDQPLLSDLQQSLQLYLDDVVWSDESDFRQLFLADYLYVNKRLSKFYELEEESEEESDEESDSDVFTKVDVDPAQRAGILTHPYLMTGLAYHKDSSPIHRGVFIARNLLGRRLKQPPDAVAPLTEEFNPKMTTRERVEHQTKEIGCMNCHSVINPLGFSLENFDAVGRFRTEEKQKQIDVSTIYKTPAGESVPLHGARELADFLANDEIAQKSFISQLFHHYAKQSINAYGEDQLDELHAKFAGSDFNIKYLLVQIAKVVANPAH